MNTTSWCVARQLGLVCRCVAGLSLALVAACGGGEKAQPLPEGWPPQEGPFLVYDLGPGTGAEPVAVADGRIQLVPVSFRIDAKEYPGQSPSGGALQVEWRKIDIRRVGEPSVSVPGEVCRLRPQELDFHTFAVAIEGDLFALARGCPGTVDLPGKAMLGQDFSILDASTGEESPVVFRGVPGGLGTLRMRGDRICADTWSTIIDGEPQLRVVCVPRDDLSAAPTTLGPEAPAGTHIGGWQIEYTDGTTLLFRPDGSEAFRTSRATRALLDAPDGSLFVAEQDPDARVFVWHLPLDAPAVQILSFATVEDELRPYYCILSFDACLALTPDAKWLLYAEASDAAAPSTPWRLRALDLRTGKDRVISESAADFEPLWEPPHNPTPGHWAVAWIDDGPFDGETPLRVYDLVSQRAETVFTLPTQRSWWAVPPKKQRGDDLYFQLVDGIEGPVYRVRLGSGAPAQRLFGGADTFDWSVNQANTRALVVDLPIADEGAGPWSATFLDLTPASGPTELLRLSPLAYWPDSGWGCLSFAVAKQVGDPAAPIGDYDLKVVCYE